MNFRLNLITGILGAYLCSSSIAATVDATELTKLVTQARTDGTVPIVVHLAPVGLDQIQKDLQGVRRAMGQKA